MFAQRGAWTLSDLGYDERAEWSLPAGASRRSSCASCRGQRVWSGEADRSVRDWLEMAAGAVLAALGGHAPRQPSNVVALHRGA